MHFHKTLQLKKHLFQRNKLDEIPVKEAASAPDLGLEQTGSGRVCSRPLGLEQTGSRPGSGANGLREALLQT